MDGGGLGLAESPADDDDLPTTVTWLPPVEAEPTDVALRPTLFIGLGGLAGRALQQLRGRLAERFGDLGEMPAIDLLLIDTDVRALTQASGGSAERSLATSQTMALPLRKTLDYRTDSRKLLRWLSRRWLYNIPRSLQTEGLRPLGRLALVDHVEQVIKRLRAALMAVTAPDALATSALHADRPFEGPPRVFVVSSISGGAGSGMVLDVAYAIQHVAGELGLNIDDLCGLLAHVTGREVTRQRWTGERTDAQRGQAAAHDLGHPLVRGCRERTDGVDDDVTTVEELTKLGRAITDIGRADRHHEEARFAREPARIDGRLEWLRQRCVGKPRTAARVRDRSDDRGITGPQHDAAAGTREHRTECRAERSGADDADGITALHDAPSGGM
jgi:hypothetical protein